MDMTIEELNKLYNEGEEVDQRVWAEMRSNILLVAGDHYARTSSRFNERIRDNKDIPQETKLRLTRNHIQRLSKIYVNAITSLSPGTDVKPSNPKELRDQKAAQLHGSVWGHLKKEGRIHSKTQEFAGDFVHFGECAVKCFWDWNKGIFKGFGQKQSVDEEGNELYDLETQEPSMEEDTTQAIWSGQLVDERIYAFNMFRPRACQDMNEAEWIGIRKMANRKDLQAIVKGDAEKLKALEEVGKTTYMVFDLHKASYEMSKDQVMLREIYWRPCSRFPKGYYYIFTTAGIVFSGELPFGIFPIIWQGFDQLPTTPRALSPIKTWKPYQVEINRVASKMAEHQITLGDDKVVVGNNAKISAAGTAPGLRAYSVSGPSTPVYLPGRTGDQYLPYLNETIQELYQTAMVAEMLEEKPPAQVDPYAMLLATAKWKQRFSIYSEKFEDFLVRWTELKLELFRRYAPEDTIIQQIGSQEQVNIANFKNSQPLCYQIEVEPSNDDVESRMGRQLTLNHIIQYAGANMDKSDLGKLFRQLPYLDNEEMLSDLTIDYDNATNDILALERGEQPMVNPYDNHPYVINRLMKRMREPDFKFLPPPIQQAFNDIKTQHEQLEQQKQLALQRAEAGFIPTTGYLVTTQVYAPDPNNPKLTKPLRLPYDSIAWLAQQLQSQGMGQAEMQQMNDAARAEMGSSMQAPQLPPGAQPPSNGPRLVPNQHLSLPPGNYAQRM